MSLFGTTSCVRVLELWPPNMAEPHYGTTSHERRQSQPSSKADKCGIKYNIIQLQWRTNLNRQAIK
jgi:hypothetical protein